VTISNFFEQSMHVAPFLPIVLNDGGQPVPADALPGYIGPYDSALDEEQVRELHDKRLLREQESNGPSGGGYGQGPAN
jgi:hypothetical protein